MKYANLAMEVGARYVLRGTIGHHALVAFFDEVIARSASVEGSTASSWSKSSRPSPGARLDGPVRKDSYDVHRHIELAPKFWANTRARLDARELPLPVGRISVPPR